MKNCVTMLLMLTLVNCSGGGADSETGGGKLLVLEGRAAMPAPVTGAEVVIFRAGEDGAEELVRSVLNECGAFTAEVPGVREEDVLLVQVQSLLDDKAPATYKDAATGATHSLKAGQLLAAYVPIASMAEGDTVTVDPWSTLSACLAEHYHQAEVQLTPDDTWASIAADAATLFGQHLNRGSPPSIPFAGTADPAAGEVQWETHQAYLGLASAGLSQLAAQEFAGTEGSEVTVLDLLDGLCMDLRDGVFDGDGQTEAGEASQQLAVAGEPLDVETTRRDLAKHINDFVNSDRNLSGIGSEPLTGPGGFYYNVSTDGPPLYPDVGSQPFDSESPKVKFIAETPANDETVCGPFTITGEATDNGEVKVLRLLKGNGGDELEADIVYSGSVATLVKEVDGADLPEGEVEYELEARDDAGNGLAESLIFLVDPNPPEILGITPNFDHCMTAPPAAITVQAADDESGVQSVEMIVGEQVHQCDGQAGAEGEWTCPGAIADGDTATFRVMDGCQEREETLTVSVCIDDEPPVITFDPPDGTWYGVAGFEVEICLQEENVFAAEVAIDEAFEAYLEDGDCQVVLLPEGAEGDTVTLEAWAVDTTDHHVEETATYHFDASGPEISLYTLQEQTAFQNMADMSFRVTVTDTGSGVAEVSADADHGIWSATWQEGDQWLVEGSADSAPEENLFLVSIFATDEANNLAEPLSVPVWVDEMDPVIGPGSYTFFDEADMAVSYDSEEGELVYDADGAAEVTFDQYSCSPDCPPFTKYSSRLNHQTMVDPAEHNIPVLSLTVMDFCPPTDDFQQYSNIQYKFFNGDEQLGNGVLGIAYCGGDTIDLPITPEHFQGVEPEDASFAPELIPDRVVLTAKDEAGRVGTTEILLDMTVISPPLFEQPLEESEQPDDLVSEMSTSAAPAMDVLFTEGGVLARKKYTNHSPVPVMLDRKYFPGEDVLFKSQRIYLPSDEQATSQCAIGQCQYYNEGSQYGVCQDSPSNFQEEDLFIESASSTIGRIVDTATNETVILDGLTSVTVPPGGAVYVDLMTDYMAEFDTSGSPFLVEAEFPGTDGEPHVANIAVEEDSKAALCHWEGAPTIHQVYTLPNVVVGYISVPSPNESLVLTVAPNQGANKKEMAVALNWAHIYIPSFPTYGLPPDN